MDVHYISPSVLPSRSANSVHVVMQTRALADSGAKVTLYGCRSISTERELPAAISRQYGVATHGISLVTTFATSSRGVNARIAAVALRNLRRARWPDLIISRNLYATYAIGVVGKRPLVFEVHDVETGARGAVFRSILRRPWIRIVSISDKLLEFIFEEHRIKPASAIVLHDAAPAGIVPLPWNERRAERERIAPVASGQWRGVCGYFGHLYSGRGIEMIESMAAARGDLLFLIVGGREEDVTERRHRNNRQNLVFLGHLPHQHALDLAKSVDVLLMPYQTNVSLGIGGRDTARWMSPMKMFEYMATGVPIVSSDLPVLREVLTDGDNAILVPHDSLDAWTAAVDRLIGDTAYAKVIADRAHAQYEARHTWHHRAQALLSAH